MINKTGGPAHDVTREKVKTAVRKMSNEKAYGPSEMIAELLKALGEYGIDWLHDIRRTYGAEIYQMVGERAIYGTNMQTNKHQIECGSFDQGWWNNIMPT